MNRYRLAHVTEFSYDAPVSESYNEVRLRPRQDDLQNCLSFRLTTDPPSRASSHVDHNGNWVHGFNILHEHRRLRVEADSVVLVQMPSPVPKGGIKLAEIADMESDLDEHLSGYLVPPRTAEPGASVEEVIGGQASHAWIEVLIPGAGWYGLDPTLGKSVGLQHVRVAYGRDYGDVAPVRGIYKGHAGQRLCVDVRVRPALDHEGHEHLQETGAGPTAPAPEGPPQQQQQ